MKIAGFILMTWGFFYVIIYSNLFTFGYSFIEYLKFMFTHVSIYLLFIGLLLILISNYRKGIK